VHVDDVRSLRVVDHPLISTIRSRSMQVVCAPGKRVWDGTCPSKQLMNICHMEFGKKVGPLSHPWSKKVLGGHPSMVGPKI
jgi:hypothetical protein